MELLEGIKKQLLKVAAYEDRRFLDRHFYRYYDESQIFSHVSESLGINERYALLAASYVTTIIEMRQSITTTMFQQILLEAIAWVTLHKQFDRMLLKKNQELKAKQAEIKIKEIEIMATNSEYDRQSMATILETMRQEAEQISQNMQTEKVKMAKYKATLAKNQYRTLLAAEAEHPQELISSVTSPDSQEKITPCKRLRA
jgi:hypothetical protein